MSAEQGTAASPGGAHDGWVDRLNRLRLVVDALADAAGVFARYAVLFVFVVGVVNVVLRYTGRAIGETLVTNLYLDLQWQFFALLALVGLGYGMKEGVNPRVDVFFAKFSPQRKAVVDLTGHVLFFIPFCVVAIWVTWPFAMTALGRGFDGTWPTWQVWQVWESSPNPDGLPLGPIKLMLVVGFVGLLVQAVVESLKCVFTLAGRDDVAQRVTNGSFSKAR